MRTTVLFALSCLLGLSVNVASGVEGVVRTPDYRFADLPDYPFPPHYVKVSPGALRMHYLDEGPTDGPVVLLLHGEPAWSYCYRHMIPPLVAAGCRVIAPDFIGFGRSDKPLDRDDQSYANQILWTHNLVTALDLREITLYCQDWGGPIGLRVVALEPDRFSGIVVSNTTLPDGTQEAPPRFLIWRNIISQYVDDFSLVMQAATNVQLSRAEKSAYDAPFPSERYKAGPRSLPQQLPIDESYPEAANNSDAWNKVFRQWSKPFLVIDGGSTQEVSHFHEIFTQEIPGAGGQPHELISEASHFIMEDMPDHLADHIIAMINSYGVVAHNQ